MTTFMFVGMIAGAVLGLLVAHPTMNLKAYTGFDNASLGTLFPILFVTVACGAVSGFHSLVSSGTSSKTIDNERDMPKVGYAPWCWKACWRCWRCAWPARPPQPTAPRRPAPRSRSSPPAWPASSRCSACRSTWPSAFMTMCVSALALTSLDAVARIGRMSFQELFSVDDMKNAEGWRKVLCNTYFATIVTLVCGFVLAKIGYSNIWPLFGSANQLLSALVLATLCVFMKVTGRSNKMLFPPLVIMLCVTFTALVQRLIALVQAVAAGSASFWVEGLQLIIAVLLIALGLTIVVSSVKAYVSSRKNAETESAKA